MRKRKKILGVGPSLIKDIDTLQQAPGTLVVDQSIKFESKERDPNELYSFNDYHKEAKDLKAFQKQFNYPELSIIFYPCSGHDPAPFLTFKNSRVIHVDKDGLAIKTLKSIGVEAYHAVVDAFNFVETVGNKANLLYILNPQVKFSENLINDCLELGGYVVCNNYHDTAIDFFEFKSLSIVGIMENDSLVAGSSPEDIMKGIIRYKKENQNALYTPRMDNRFIYRKIK